MSPAGRKSRCHGRPFDSNSPASARGNDGVNGSSPGKVEPTRGAHESVVPVTRIVGPTERAPIRDAAHPGRVLIQILVPVVPANSMLVAAAFKATETLDDEKGDRGFSMAQVHEPLQALASLRAIARGFADGTVLHYADVVA